MVDDMYDAFIGIVAIGAALIAVPTLAGLVLALFEGFPRLRLGQIAGMVAVAAWVFGLFAAPGPWEAQAYLCWSVVGLVLTCFGLWKRELGHLMAHRDDEFPGRYDKVFWMVVLTVLAPIGIWTFRSYRLRHWPGLGGGRRKPAPTRARSSPWDDEADAHSPAGAGVE